MLPDRLRRPAPRAWQRSAPKRKAKRRFPCRPSRGVLTVHRFRNVCCLSSCLPHSVAPVGLGSDRHVHFSLMAPSIGWLPLLQAGPFGALRPRVLKWVSEGEAVLLTRLKPESRLIFYEPTSAVFTCLSCTSQSSSNKS